MAQSVRVAVVYSFAHKPPPDSVTTLFSKVDSDTATSVALVVNELLQNALKYAFHEGDDGHVRILVTRGALYAQIIVEDDGEGPKVIEDYVEDIEKELNK